MAERLDALDLHAIGRLVLSAGIGPRWNLSEHARGGSVTVLDEDGEQVRVALWHDCGHTVGGAREVAEEFVDELERAGFQIVRVR